MTVQRILVVAHGHPAFTRGGAEIAAYQLFGELARRPGLDVHLLARHSVPGLERPGTPFSLRPGGREILYRSDTDYFDFSAKQLRFLAHDVPQLLAELKPDVVHFHHYVNVGIELLRVVRNCCPDARIVLTLHEFLAICNHNGQMLKTDGRLCREASPQDCHVCMPGRSPQDYFLREMYIKSFLRLVDAFIAPSEFLKSRYVAWGLPAERISVVENGQPPVAPAPPRALRNGDGRTSFGFLGQITPYKGLEVLLDAFTRLPERLRERCRLEIHGTGQQMFTADFRDRIDRRLREMPANVYHGGPYAPEDLPTRMGRLDWVVVPSIWWENSPLVIQEAFRHGRPVICGDAGGMAEKVRDGVDGMHYHLGDPAALAERLRVAAEDPGLWQRLRDGIRQPPSIAESADACLALYGVAA